MIEIKLDIDNAISKDLERIKRALPQTAKQGLAEYQRLTPVRSGQARRKTTVSGNSIQANYPYAGVLDLGRGQRDGQMRGSTQAPKGMTEPWTKWLEQHVDKIFKG